MQHFNITQSGAILNKVPTGVLYVSLNTNVSVGCTVTGPGIEPGTEVTSVVMVDDYLVIEIQGVNGSSAIPWDGYSVPSGVNDYGIPYTSEFTELTLGYTSSLTFNCLLGSSTEYIVTDVNETITAKTLSFKEDVKGWVSFKSFAPENAISMANDYYTFNNGGLYQHHIETSNRNTFYVDQLGPINSFTSSSVSVVLNNNPSIIKEFVTLNYEGSQSKVEKFKSEPHANFDGSITTYNDQEFYNLSSKLGWYTQSIITNEEDGHIDEFLEKEGKWFNYIKREIDFKLNKADTGDFSFQGIGFVDTLDSDNGGGGGGAGGGGGGVTCYRCNGNVLDSSTTNFIFLGDGYGCPEGWITTIPNCAEGYGCTDQSAINYDPLAIYDDGSCYYEETPGQEEEEDLTDTDTDTDDQQDTFESGEDGGDEFLEEGSEEESGGGESKEERGY